MPYQILEANKVVGHENDPYRYLIVSSEGGQIVAATDYLYYAVRVVKSLDILERLEL